MKRLFILVMVILSGFQSFSQVYNQDVENIIDQADLTSLIFYMRNLSGEDPVVINGNTETITHRVSNWGNDLAAEYLKETLEGFGLTTTVQTYSSSGKNVYAVKQGSLYPDEYVMICAHYDSVDYYCADDNASGSSAVIEAARIFSDLDFEYSIIFALWDEEELGLIGSNVYATQAANNGDIIHAVINLDMIAWDSDDDMVVEIHSSYMADSNVLGSYIVEVNNIYDLPLVTSLKLNGTGASDHASFWSNGYASALLIEEYYGGDFNPYYHTENDRISILNMPYFHEMTKLSFGVLASKAVPYNTSGIDDEIEHVTGIQLTNYPNPSFGETNIKYTLEKKDFVRVSLLNTIGEEVVLIDEGVKHSGEHQYLLHTENLAPGVYFLCLESSEGTLSNKLMVK